MAFQSYDSVAVKTLDVGSFKATHTINFPACNIGDHCLVLLALIADAAGSIPDIPDIDGFFLTDDQGFSGSVPFFHYRYGVYRHYCNGAEEDGVEITTSVDTKMLAVVIRWPGLHQNPNSNLAIGWTSLASQGITDAPSFPSLDPAWVGAEDVVWMAIAFHQDDDDAVSANGYPANYVDGDQLVSGLGVNAGAGIAWSFRNLNAESETPGAMAFDAVERIWTMTLAIRPWSAPTISSTGYLSKNFATDIELLSLNPAVEEDSWSLTKLNTIANLMRENAEAQMSDTITIVADDITTGTGNNLLAGDVISKGGLRTNSLLPSSNTACEAIASNTGAGATHADRVSNFLTAFMDALNTTLGLTSPSIGWGSAGGFPTGNKLTPRDVHTLLEDLLDDQGVLDTWVLPRATINMDRGGSFDLAVEHTLLSSGFVSATNTKPLGGKTGGSTNYAFALVWDAPNGQRVSFIGLGAASSEARYDDARYLIKQVIEANPALLVAATAVGQASETEQALAATASKLKAAGQASESEQALVASASKLNAVGQASESEQSLAAVAKKVLAAGQAIEVEVARPASAAKLRQAGLAEETEIALPAVVSGSVPAGQASETEQALAASAFKRKAVGQATETETALPVVSGLTLVPAVRVAQAASYRLKRSLNARKGLA